MNSEPRYLWLPLLLAPALFGCHAESEPEPRVEPPKMAALEQKPEAKPVTKAAAPTPDLANPKVSTAAQPSTFTPPFPDRLELFEPPKRAQTSVKRDDEHGQSVELKGFIDVDQPRVILSIDGVVSPVPEGGEKYGVHVISIQPPSVVLQRGRNRWTATLE
jgi:hypothetical protein